MERGKVEMTGGTGEVAVPGGGGNAGWGGEIAEEPDKIVAAGATRGGDSDIVDEIGDVDE